MHELSENVQHELSRLVERTVRPLRASLSRKRRMREELLGHLEAVYEENYQQSHDEQAALSQTKTRFGDPGVLSHELKKSLPRGDFVQYVLEKHRWEPGESAGRFIVKHVALSTALWGLMLLLLMIVAYFFPGRPTTMTLRFRLVTTVALLSTVYSTLTVFLGTQLCRALYGDDSRKSLRQAAGAALGSLGIIPALTLLAYLGLAGEVPPSSALLIAGCSSPMSLVLFLLIARKAAADIRYEQEWASLKIEE
jgi:ATP-dependent Clp protease ATP-binding subunit ClpC